MEMIVYTSERDGKFQIGAPYLAMKVTARGNGAKWTIYGTRQDVSATVRCRAVNLNFYTKRDAISAAKQAGLI